MRRRRLRRRSTAERGDARAVVGGAIGRRVALDASVRRHLTKPEQDVDVVGIAHRTIFRDKNNARRSSTPATPPRRKSFQSPPDEVRPIVSTGASTSRTIQWLVSDICSCREAGAKVHRADHLYLKVGQREKKSQPNKTNWGMLFYR